MPTSWLIPAVAVHRSALPLISREPSLVGCSERSRPGSMATQLWPSLSAREYCCWLTCDQMAAGASRAVSLVGEKAPLIGPAPMKIVTPFAGLLVFHFAVKL